MRKALFGLIPLAAVALASYLVMLDRQGRLVWDHWDEVKKDVLYRSGQLSSNQLADAIRRYHLKTVINLQLPGPELIEERAVSREMGVDFVNLPMPGDGLGEESQFRKILSILDDPSRRPALVHCARGTCRTGAAVAFYRFERDGWTLEDVAAELKRQSYKYGWLPGYIYAMIKTKPAVSFPKAGTIEDRNSRVAVGFQEEAIHGR